ncbi:MAG TPA: MOSC N-terminal beta barrel domain-containing protein [Acetobacteraceae bacterium]|nr:MOSC N-terminal beta barrel domain-containing protein [Acetobacteraceae bacterium]
MRVDYVYRYPVKGLSAEALEWAEVEAGGAIPWDRAFALAQGDAGFDPAAPRWLPKSNFMCLMKNARIAALRAFFEPRSGVLTIRSPDGAEVRANALTEEGRRYLEVFLVDFLGAEARGAPRFHYVPGHMFSDQSRKVISLIGLSSLRDFETRVGARRHRRRFRANIWFSGAAPLAELGWVGREIQIGRVRMRVIKRIPRCAATEVNPETAERDAETVQELRLHYGHADFGVYAEVLDGGRFAVGDAMELLPE